MRKTTVLLAVKIFIIFYVFNYILEIKKFLNLGFKAGNLIFIPDIK